jgi:hypothetical protein
MGLVTGVRIPLLAVTEINRIHSVLIGMQNMTFDPYLAPMNSVPVSVMNPRVAPMP